PSGYFSKQDYASVMGRAACASRAAAKRALPERGVRSVPACEKKSRKLSRSEPWRQRQGETPIIPQQPSAFFPSACALDHILCRQDLVAYRPIADVVWGMQGSSCQRDDLANSKLRSLSFTLNAEEMVCSRAEEKAIARDWMQKNIKPA